MTNRNMVGRKEIKEKDCCIDLSNIRDGEHSNWKMKPRTFSLLNM